MKLAQVFQSIQAWQKLSAIAVKPALAYKILKYVKLVLAEYDVAEKQRIALVREITKTKDGEQARIEPETPEFAEYSKRFSEVLMTDVSLAAIDMDFEEVLRAVGDREGVLSVSDLAVLEPFFKTEEEA